MKQSIIEVTIDSWKGFIEYIEQFKPHMGRYLAQIGFRGQEKNRQWGLKSSFSRQFPNVISFEESINLERFLQKQFRTNAHRILLAVEVPEPSDDYEPLGWFSIMQQYGAPTRLLDWTFSPYVAAYFAVKNSIEEDGVVWIIDYFKLVSALQVEPKTKASLKSITKTFKGEKAEKLSNPPGICAVIQQFKLPERMHAQQGFYLVCMDPRRDYDEVMAEIAIKAGMKPFLHKVIIPAGAKLEFLANIHLMNITGFSLFPGADGWGKYISESSKLFANRLPTTIFEEDNDTD